MKLFAWRTATVDRPARDRDRPLVMAGAADEIGPRQRRPCGSPRQAAGECDGRDC